MPAEVVRRRSRLAGLAAAAVALAVVPLPRLAPDGHVDGSERSADGSPSATDGDVQVPDPQDVIAAPERPADAASAPTARGELWRTEIPAAAARTARAFGDAVITVSADGRVTAVERRDGEVRWRRQVPQRSPTSQADPWGPFLTSSPPMPAQLLAPVAGTVPVVRQGVLSFLDLDRGITLGAVGLPVAGEHLAAVGPWVVTSDGTGIAAIGIPATVAWERDVPDGHTVELRGHGSYLLADDEVVRLSGNTGEDRWRTSVGAPARLLEVRSEADELLVAADGDDPSLVALDPEDGSERWRTPVHGPIEHLAVGSDRMLLSVPDDGGVRVLVLAPDDDGRFVVRRQLDLERTDELLQLLLVGRQIVAVTGAPDHRVVLATSDGFPRLTLPADRATRVTAPEPRTLLVSDRDGVAAVALANGTERYRLAVHGARPVAGAANVFGGTDQLVAVAPTPTPGRRGPCPLPGPGCPP